MSDNEAPDASGLSPKDRLNRLWKAASPDKNGKIDIRKLAEEGDWLRGTDQIGPQLPLSDDPAAIRAAVIKTGGELQAILPTLKQAESVVTGKKGEVVQTPNDEEERQKATKLLQEIRDYVSHKKGVTKKKSEDPNGERERKNEVVEFAESLAENDSRFRTVWERLNNLTLMEDEALYRDRATIAGILKNASTITPEQLKSGLDRLEHDRLKEAAEKGIRVEITRIKQEAEAEKGRMAEEAERNRRAEVMRKRLGDIKTLEEFISLGLGEGDEAIKRAAFLAGGQRELYHTEAQAQDGYWVSRVTEEDRKKFSLDKISDLRLRGKVQEWLDTWKKEQDEERRRDAEKLRSWMMENVVGPKLVPGSERISRLLGRDTVLTKLYGEDKADNYAEKLATKIDTIQAESRKDLGRIKRAKLHGWQEDKIDRKRVARGEGTVDEFEGWIVRQVNEVGRIDTLVAESVLEAQSIYLIDKGKSGSGTFSVETARRKNVANVVAAFLQRRQGAEIKITEYDPGVIGLARKHLEEVGFSKEELEDGKFRELVVGEKYQAREILRAQFLKNRKDETQLISHEIEASANRSRGSWVGKLAENVAYNVNNHSNESSTIRFSRSETSGGVSEGLEAVNEFVDNVSGKLLDDEFVAALGISDELIGIMTPSDWVSVTTAIVRGRMGMGTINYSEVEGHNYQGKRARSLGDGEGGRIDSMILDVVTQAYLTGFMLRTNYNSDRNKVSSEVWKRTFGESEEEARRAAAILAG